MAGSYTLVKVNLLYEDETIDEPGPVLKSPFEIRGTNLGGGEQAYNLIDERVGAGSLIVLCNLTQVIHGTLEENGSAATLAVFQFAFVPRGSNRRFEKIEIDIAFSSGVVCGICPSGESRIFRSEEQHELTRSISPELEAGVGAAKATLGFSWDFTVSRTVASYARVNGLILATGGRAGGHRTGRKDTAFWGLYENPQSKSGIPSFMQTAVLLDRGETGDQGMNEKFSAEITINGEVHRDELDVDGRFKETVKKVKGKGKQGQNIIFNPKVSRGSVNNATKLASVNLDHYGRLITVREWEEGGSEIKTVPPEYEILPPKSDDHFKSMPTTGIAVPSPSIVVSAPVSHSVSENYLPADANPPHIESSSDLPSVSQDLDSTLGSPIMALPDTGLPRSLTNKHGQAAISGIKQEDAVAQHSAVSNPGRRLCRFREQLSMAQVEAAWVERMITLVGEQRKYMELIRQLEDLANESDGE